MTGVEFPAWEKQGSPPPFVAVDFRNGTPVVTGRPDFDLNSNRPTSESSRAQRSHSYWFWNGDSLVVQSEARGVRLIYFFRQGSRLVLSPSITELLHQGAPGDLDWEALSVFLRWGNFLAQDTAFQAIRALPPNSRGRWSEGVWTVEGSLPDQRATSIPLRTALREYDDVLRTVVAGIGESPFFNVVPLSGGRDSRHILLAMHDAGLKPDLCVTAQYPYHGRLDEITAAAALTNVLRIPHTVLPPPTDRVGAETRKNYATGFTSLEHAWYYAVVDGVLERSPSEAHLVVLDGLGGDVLSAGLYATRDEVSAFEAGQLRELADRLLFGQRHGPQLLEKCLRPEFSKKVDPDRARSRLILELQRHESAPNPMVSFLYYNRTRRGVGGPSFNMWGTAAELRFPYLEDAVFDFLMGLPAEMTINGAFHSRAIALAYPRVATVPYSRKKAIWTDAVGQFRSDARAILRTTRLGAHLPLVRSAWAAPRLLRCSISADYSRNMLWMGPLLIYLRDLASAAVRLNKGRPAGFQTSTPDETPSAGG